MTNTERDLQFAAALIVACERDLRQILSDGEMRDLLTDNTKFSRDTIVSLVASLTMTWGVGAFTLAEARKRSAPAQYARLNQHTVGVILDTVGDNYLIRWKNATSDGHYHVSRVTTITQEEYDAQKHHSTRTGRSRHRRIHAPSDDA